MNDSKISVRYAKALFDSAREQGLLDTVRKDMLHLKTGVAYLENNNLLAFGKFLHEGQFEFS